MPVPRQLNEPSPHADSGDRSGGSSRDPRPSASAALPYIHLEHERLLDLPPRLNTIIGRDDELRIITDLLATERFVTLTGPGGVGKTRLAIECAYHQAQHGTWRRIHVVPFTTVSDPSLVVAMLADVLGLAPARAANQVAAALADRPTLLVLDGFDRVLAAAGDLDRLLASAPKLSILVTSRQAIGHSREVVHEVPCLSLPDLANPTTDSDAATLFIDRVRRADPAFRVDPGTMPLIAAICHQLDGLPLAIELAAARVKLLPLEALHERLAEQIDILSGGPRDQLPHQRSMRGTIAWSYDTLAPDEQALFRALSWFDMPFSVESARAMQAGLGGHAGPDAATERIIGTLAARHLLRRMPAADDDRPTFQFLTTMRTFGRERSRQLGEDLRLKQAHAEGIAALATRYLALRQDGTIDQRVLPAVARIYPDIERALDWFEAFGDAEPMLNVVITLAPYWTHRSARTAGCRWFERALARVTPTTAESLLARAELEFAALLRTSRTGDLEHAQTVTIRSLDRFRRLDDRTGMVAAQNMLGVLQRAQSDLAHAEGTFDAALALAEQAGHAWWKALVLCNLGATMLWQGETREARQRVEEAIRQFQELDDNRGIAFSMHILALIRCIQGDARTAALIAATGLDHAAKAEARETTIDLIAAAGFIAAAGGAFAPSITLLETADHLANQASYRMERPERETYEDARRIARRALGPDQAERLIQNAAHCPLEVAVARARTVLEETRSAPTPTPHAVVTGTEYDLLAQTLTIREHQVLALLAQRYTDREIAETLQISVRTVSRHVSNVFGKLGLHSRRDISAGFTESATLDASPKN